MKIISFHPSAVIPLLFSLAMPMALLSTASAEVQLTVAHDSDGVENFRLGKNPPPSRNDAAATATLTLLDGESDPNGGGLRVLTDGQLARHSDDPERSFFFAPSTPGGRVLMDLGKLVDVKQINVYSWHPSTRGPQFFKLFASAGTGAEFNSKPARTADFKALGWESIIVVDTRSRGGGQHVVSIASDAGNLGKFRYLLFDISPAETDDAFGNTFYTEIDVIDANAPAEEVAADAPLVIRSADDYCDIVIETSAAPELRDWAQNKLGPVLAEWFPKLVAMLPSEGYEPPSRVSISIRPMDGVAFASGNRISANSTWLGRELDGEAIGALIHEMVHVIQHPGRGQRGPGGGQRTPGWLVEGIPDYIRFFLFEPQTHGADLTWLRARRNVALNYDARYRVTANFLNYVVDKYDSQRTLIARINAACRERRYTDDLWKEYTGRTLQELNDEWKTVTTEQIAASRNARLNELTESEKAAGWQLLFNGLDFSGWRNFKRNDVRPGWQVRDGILVCADPKNAGDLVTTEMFDAFELELEYNIARGGNSGILFHVTDEGGAVWATGPEFQLEDNAEAKDPQRCGWLYGLYQPPLDHRTGKPIDATRPAGEWNHVRLRVTPERCEHHINDVKYFEYVLGSDDFNRRVAASKFSRMPLFAKSSRGYIALQGDHGEVSFRNIKIRRIPGNTAKLNTEKVQ